jgi:hypothetical protein
MRLVHVVQVRRKEKEGLIGEHDGYMSKEVGS